MEIRVFKQMAEEGMKFCFKEDPAGPSGHSGWKLCLSVPSRCWERVVLYMHLSLQLGCFCSGLIPED